MFKTTIYDLDAYPVNERNGTYGGKSGDKEAITIITKQFYIRSMELKDTMSYGEPCIA